MKLYFLSIFKIIYQDLLTELVPFAWDFIEKRWQQLVWKEQRDGGGNNPSLAAAGLEGAEGWRGQ